MDGARLMTQTGQYCPQKSQFTKETESSLGDIRLTAGEDAGTFEILRASGELFGQVLARVHILLLSRS